MGQAKNVLPATTVTADALSDDALDAITDIAASIRSGSDTKILTGTPGTSGNVPQWDANGDLIDSGSTPGAGGNGGGEVFIGRKELGAAANEIEFTADDVADLASGYIKWRFVLIVPGSPFGSDRVDFRLRAEGDGTYWDEDNYSRDENLSNTSGGQSGDVDPELQIAHGETLETHHIEVEVWHWSGTVMSDSSGAEPYRYRGFYRTSGRNVASNRSQGAAGVWLTFNNVAEQDGTDSTADGAKFFMSGTTDDLPEGTVLLVFGIPDPTA